MSATERGAPAPSATADREIVISRVISAPPELVFEAFTEVRHLSRWWGPEGFTTTTRAFEFRVGGSDRPVHDRALTRAVRLRNPPVRGRGRGPRGPGAGPRGADAAGDPPDLRCPGAVTVSTSALPRRGWWRWAPCIATASARVALARCVCV